MKCIISILSLWLSSSFIALYAAEKSFVPVDTTVGEFFTNPLGKDLSDLSFSWKLPAIRDGIAQSAYEIEVFKDGQKIWGSGKVDSSDSVKVPYGGGELKSAQKFSWRVRVWDEKGAVSDWSDFASFETGLLKNSDWKGLWIYSPENAKPLYKVSLPKRIVEVFNKTSERFGVAPVYLRKTFKVKDGLKSARLYVASRGIFEFTLNGKNVTDEKWGTGWTSYDKRVTSDTFDITNLLERGENTVGAILADGWYAGRITARNGFSPKPELLAQIELAYNDGTKEIVATDSSWKASTGGYIFSDIYDGEYFDARLEPYGWNKNGFDDSSWKNAKSGKSERLYKDSHPVFDAWKKRTENAQSEPIITPRRNQPVKVCGELTPISVREISKGVFVFDFGQNMVGVPRISIKGKEGFPVQIRFAEMLNKDGTLYTDNYRSAKSTDFFIPKSGGLETYTPKFTFHGFRYMELSGLAENWRPALDSVKGLVMHNDMPLSGTFLCSHPKINILQSNIQWGQRGNYFSVPTDCPQRDERMGWTGDAQVFIPTAAFNMNVNGFFSKWNQDMRDIQSPNGMMAHVVPNSWGGGSPAWGDAAVVCPWEIYLAYGDKKSLAENFEMMKGWVDFQKNTSKNLIRPDEGFGDWLQPSTTRGKDSKLWRGATPRPLIGTAYFARTAEIVSKTAKILGKDGEAKKYADLARDVRAAFIKEFVKDDGTVKSDCQTAYLLPLAFDILPDNLKDKAFAKLLKVLARDKWYLDTGFVGTPLLNPVLTKFGRMDLAYRIICNEGYPSWIYSINQGATTMWERWNSYSHEKGFGEAAMNSFNHYAYGAIGEWLYRDVAGIWHDENNVGYKNIIFAPKPGGGLTFASATYQSPYGLVVSNWQVKDGVMVWNVVVPPNSTGTLVVPAKNPKDVLINGKAVDKLKVEVASGTYRIEAKL